jgi:hypothetical protein
MYIEDKSGGVTGACRIGRVRFSKTGLTLYYGGRRFGRLKGCGFKANYFDEITGEQFWISGPHRDGADGLYGRITQPRDVDTDIAETYWRDIRGLAPPKETAPEIAPWDMVPKSQGEPALRHGRAGVRINRILASNG